MRSTKKRYRKKKKQTGIVQTTNHGSLRMKQRSGITVNNQQKMNQKIFKYGIDVNNTKGELRTYLNNLSRQNPRKVIKIYGNNIYLFKNFKLITVLNIPQEITQNFLETIEPQAYLAYLINKNSKDTKAIKEAIKNTMLKYFSKHPHIPSNELIIKIKVKQKEIKIEYKSQKTFNGESRKLLHNYFNSTFKLNVIFKKNSNIKPNTNNTVYFQYKY